ncbi:hypothetical protein JOD29_001869 [Lysinibacillus composti]|uniref:hypothetical protein n=1 Tax=Lysinibacillus composti TaxID=720633 RepID=UPI001864594D|nr:hypothetical protein [Lysinibacillus composti]MBM7608622.1 hypothetical protein [Lysinibacillus composti]
MNSYNMKTIISKNLNDYIKSTGRSHVWIMEKAEIPKTTYYKLLNGEGDLEKHIEKIINLFGIDDPFYFHTKDFAPPKSIQEIQAELDLRNLAAANYIAVEDKQEIAAFDETVEILDDFITMIDILKRNKVTLDFDHMKAPIHILNQEIYKENLKE